MAAMRITRREAAQRALVGGGALIGLGVLATTRAEGAAMSTDRPDEGKRQETRAVTRHVAAFCAHADFKDLPAEVLDLGKKSILDGLGLALAGSVADTGRICRTHLDRLGLAPGRATVIGSALKVPARFAAFANGIAMHADDYDDTQLAVAADRVYGLLTHPTSSVLSSALAVAEAGGGSGRDLLLAYHVGVEVACKVAEAINPRHYQEGFHSTGTCNAFGAAAAAAKLRKLDIEQQAQALGLAGAQASGLRENFGTMTKPFHAGRAAESGVLAAEFVAQGWTASDQILEAPRGFFQAAGGGFDPAAIMNRLGRPWTFASPGISIKPHPSGSLTHPGMTVLLRLIQENGLRADQVERIDVGTNRNMPNALIHHQPKDHLQAKFSMEFCMAALLLFGRAGLGEFTDEVVKRPDVQAMIQRVRFGVHPEAEAAGYNKMTTIVDVRTKDGRTLSGRSDFAKGSPDEPMSYDEVAAKFLECAAYARWPDAKAKSIVATVRGLQDLADVTTLAALCAA
jgi:2-methylcitrate dehydratase PrpD